MVEGACTIVAIFVETSVSVPRHASDKCSSRERLLSVPCQVVTAKRASHDLHTARLLVFLREALPVAQAMTVLEIIIKEFR